MPAEENGSLILEGLNGQQRQAVQHGDRPLLIVAGAGTGKTKTLVHRVAQQIQQGIAPGADSAADVHPPRGGGNVAPGRWAAEATARQWPPAAAADPTSRRSGAAPFTPPPPGCCGCMPPPPDSNRPSPSWTAAIPRTCWTSSAPNWDCPRPTSVFRAKGRAWRSTATASTRSGRWKKSWRPSSRGAATAPRT